MGAAHRLFTNMNTSADPCQDFEEFTCGRFQQDFQIPEDKGSWYASFSPLSDTIYERGRREAIQHTKKRHQNIMKITIKFQFER